VGLQNNEAMAGKGTAISLQFTQGRNRRGNLGAVTAAPKAWPAVVKRYSEAQNTVVRRLGRRGL